MKNILKGLGLGLIVLALVVVVGASKADAALTLAALAASSDGALTITSAAGSPGTLFPTTTTGSIALGTGLTSGDLTLGNNVGSGIVYIYGNGGINIGAVASDKTIAIGSATGVSALNLLSGTGGVNVTGQILSPLGSFTAPTYSFTGDTNTGIYSQGADTISFAVNGAFAGRFDTSGFAVASPGILSTAINSSPIGATTPATGAFTTLAGNGNLTLGPATSHVISSQTTAPTTTAAAPYTAGIVLAGSSDTKGQFTVTATAAPSTATLVFNTAYALAPICTVSPASALTQPEAGKIYVSSTTTDLTIHYVVAPAATLQTWNYICVQ